MGTRRLQTCMGQEEEKVRSSCQRSTPQKTSLPYTITLISTSRVAPPQSQPRTRTHTKSEIVGFARGSVSAQAWLSSAAVSLRFPSILPHTKIMWLERSVSKRRSSSSSSRSSSKQTNRAARLPCNRTVLLSTVPSVSGRHVTYSFLHDVDAGDRGRKTERGEAMPPISEPGNFFCRFTTRVMQCGSKYTQRGLQKRQGG
jgi:hypothetical protein